MKTATTMRIGEIAFTAFLCTCLVLPNGNDAFTPSRLKSAITSQQHVLSRHRESQTSPSVVLLAAEDDDNEEGKKEDENPYSDPNYPDLEFVNYDDPDYKVDQGVGDEFYDPDSTEAQIEVMREERRQRNDEYQFETYYKDILQGGKEYKGEWTVFETSTFMDGVDNDAANGGIPRLMKVAKPLRVISWSERVTKDSDEETVFACDNDRIIHKEKIYSDPDEEKDSKQIDREQKSIEAKFWPDEMTPFDFRGQQGNMCVGSAYTICTAMGLDSGEYCSEGPFSEYRAEIGALSEELRFRIKLDYAVLDEEKVSQKLPPLHLRTMTICRETLEAWPRADNYQSAMGEKTQIPFWGPAGAPGGLYDPPPVGSEEQASQYIMLDLEGMATLLLPYKLDQDDTTHPDSNGWVTSLDWTPGALRFQVDRKVRNGKDVLGLRTLELSEVQGSDADTWRPKDGGNDMRQ